MKKNRYPIPKQKDERAMEVMVRFLFGLPKLCNPDSNLEGLGRYQN